MPSRSKQSQPEKDFQALLTSVGGIPADEIETEYQFYPERKWRADFHIPKIKMLLEMEGGTRGKGPSRHTSYHGYQADLVKYSWASCLGFTLVRTTPDPRNMFDMATLAGKVWKARTKA